MPGVFQIPAHSYDKPKNKQGKQKRKLLGGDEDDNNEEKSSRPTLNKKVWFTSTARFRWPDTLSVRPCIKFGQQGLACRNPNCSFDHKIFPQHFSEVDKNIIIQFEKDTDCFSFVPYIATKLKQNKSQPGTNAGPS